MNLLPVHVIGGAIAIATGFVALYALKGGSLHRSSRTIFVYAMLLMSLTGAVAAFRHPGTAMNVPAGQMTAYLAVTSPLTVRPSSAANRRVERGAMVAAFALGVASFALALVSGVRGNAGFVFPLLMFGTLAVSAGAGDRRMILA